MSTSSGVKLRCFSETGVHLSSISGKDSSPPTHADTRLGSVGNRSSAMKASSRSSRSFFCCPPSWPQFASLARTFGDLSGTSLLLSSVMDC